MRRSASAFALFVCSPLAWALGNSQDPNQVPVTNPGTPGQLVSLWKLVGKVSGVSGVQIAPDWLLASRHASPKAGDTFSNGYGSAQIDTLPGSPAAMGSGASGCVTLGNTVDLSLCRLKSRIALPNGDRFPRLLKLDVPIKAISGTQRSKGYFLTVGGGAPSGKVTYSWTDANGIPYGYSPITQPEAKAPFHASGDSGGAKFWFVPEQPDGVLAGIVVFAGPVSFGFQAFDESVASWVTSVIADPQQAPQWVKASEFASRTLDELLPPRLDNFPTANALTATSTATSLSLKWGPPSTPGSFDNYLVMMGTPGANGTIKSAFVPKTATSYTFTGLSTGAHYAACVLPVSAIGAASSGDYAQGSDGGIAHYNSCLYAYTGLAPNAVTNVQVSAIPVVIAGHEVKNITWSWTAPVPKPGAVVVGYDVVITSTVNGNTSSPALVRIGADQTSYTYVGAERGRKVCTFIIPVGGSNTAGPGATGPCYSY